MTSQWRDFLRTDTARHGAAVLPTFTEPADASACRLFDLSQLGLIAVRGADAENFIQGQFTNDIRQVSATHTQLTAHCSHKGRMLANCRVMRIAGTLLLQLPAERVPELLKRLRMFVLRSQVTLEDVSDQLIRVGLAGECAPTQLSDQGLPVPARDNDLALGESIAVLRLPGPVPRFELVGPFPAMRACWSALVTHASPAPADGWRLLDIRAGLPTVYDRTAEFFVPQMLNLQLIDGVSFNKGCYTGQEVVARTQHLGKLKRRMYLAEVDAVTPPQPGDELHAPVSTSEQKSGWVVDACPVGEGRYALLVVAEISIAEGGEVRLGADGPALQLMPPPYGFPSEPRSE